MIQPSSGVNHALFIQELLLVHICRSILGGEMWMCGLKVWKGQWIWFARLEAACRLVTGNKPLLWPVCYRRSSRPLGNPLVPTVSFRGFYQSQSGEAAQLKRLWWSLLVDKNKFCSAFCTQQPKAAGAALVVEVSTLRHDLFGFN